MVSGDGRWYTITTESGCYFVHWVPTELERKSELLQNTLAADFEGPSPSLALPGHAREGLEAWIQISRVGSAAVLDVFGTDQLLKALTTADFFGDAENVKLAADALAARLFNVSAGQIAHGMGPKGPTHAGSAQNHSSEQSVSDASAEVGSREKVAENKKILQGLPDHLALAILSSSSTSLSTCVRALPVSLLPLALEALCPSIRTSKHLSLAHLTPPPRSSEKATVLRAAATFTSLESLTLSSKWTRPYAGPVENSFKQLVKSLHPTLKKLQIQGLGAAECWMTSLSTLQSLESFVLKPESITHVKRASVSLQQCLRSLCGMTALRDLILHNVLDDSEHGCTLTAWDMQGLSSLSHLDLRCKFLAGSCLSPMLSKLWSGSRNMKALHLRPFCYRESDALAFPWQPTALISIAELQSLTSLTLGRLYAMDTPPDGHHPGHNHALVQQRHAAVSAALVETLARLLNLQSLELDGYCVACQFYERLAKSISTMKQLESLRFVHFCEQSDTMWRTLSQGPSFPRKLQSLQLSKFLVSKESQRNIGALLLHLTELQELCIDFCRVFEIPDQFWEGLAQLTSLRALSLCGNFLFTADAEHIANCCASIQLTRLDLCGNNLGFSSLETSKALVSCVASSPALTVLSLVKEEVLDADAFQAEVDKVVSTQTVRSAHSGKSVVCWDQWPAHIAEHRNFEDSSELCTLDSDNASDN